VSSVFDWKSAPSASGAKLAADDKKRTRPGAPITLSGSNRHGGAYTKAHAAPTPAHALDVVTDAQVAAADDFYGVTESA
jgi:hypothetical protein